MFLAVWSGLFYVVPAFAENKEQSKLVLDSDYDAIPDEIISAFDSALLKDKTIITSKYVEFGEGGIAVVILQEEKAQALYLLIKGNGQWHIYGRNKTILHQEWMDELDIDIRTIAYDMWDRDSIYVGYDFPEYAGYEEGVTIEPGSDGAWFVTEYSFYKSKGDHYILELMEEPQSDNNCLLKLGMWDQEDIPCHLDMEFTQFDRDEAQALMQDLVDMDKLKTQGSG